MSFRPKNSKEVMVNKKDIVTLDSKHDEYINLFHQYETVVIPKLIGKKTELLKQLNDKKNKKQIRDSLNIIDQLKIIDKKIKHLKQEKKNYYIKNSNYIFDYFEMKKKISSDSKKPKILESFFNVNKNENKQKLELNENTVINYLMNTGDDFLQLENYVYNKELCQYCHKGELIPIDYEGIMVCDQCFRSVSYIFDSDKPSYKDPPKEACFYAYKRINHFREILAQFQAKETTQIPDKLIEDLKRQIKKERLELHQITNNIAKSMLKKLNYNKFYEHIPFIKDKLGIKPPVMTQELEEKLCSLFLEIQRPYSRVCPDNRVNFLNYYYTIYKLCEMLNQNQFLEYFPMLKDREKRIEQDEIWKKICKDLKWRFIPTV
jgi:hypothetical protein